MIFLTGITLGVFSVVQTTMLADAVDSAERETGMRNDGLSFSSLTFVGKLMSSLSVLVFGMMLASTGYESGIVVTQGMKNTVFLAITLIPAASCLVSMFRSCFSAFPKRKQRWKPVRTNNPRAVVVVPARGLLSVVGCFVLGCSRNRVDSVPGDAFGLIQLAFLALAHFLAREKAVHGCSLPFEIRAVPAG